MQQPHAVRRQENFLSSPNEVFNLKGIFLLLIEESCRPCGGHGVLERARIYPAHSFASFRLEVGQQDVSFAGATVDGREKILAPQPHGAIAPVLKLVSLQASHRLQDLE
jgi:hypothetical protein